MAHRSFRLQAEGISEVDMKRVLSWTGGILLGLVVLGATAHASTSVEAHENGDCVSCNFFECLHSALYQAFHHS
jgi:hypothetical protein